MGYIELIKGAYELLGYTVDEAVKLGSDDPACAATVDDACSLCDALKALLTGWKM